MRILIIVVTAILFVLWIEFNFFPFIPCDCSADKINSIISNLSLATIAAAIFYFIDIYLKELIETRKLRPHLVINYEKIINIAFALRKNIEDSSNQKFSQFPPTAQELQALLLKIPLDSIYDQNRVVKLTWEDRIKEVVNDTRFYINRLYTFSTKIDTDTLVLLNLIYDCKFFGNASIAPISTIIANIPHINQSNINSMSIHSEQIDEYFRLIDELTTKINP